MCSKKNNEKNLFLLNMIHNAQQRNNFPGISSLDTKMN